MTVVERLAQYLEAEGITLSKFTEFTGIPSDRARQWLKGNGNPKAEDERKIEDFIAGKRQLTAHIHGSKSHDLLVQSLQDQIETLKDMKDQLLKQLEMEREQHYMMEQVYRREFFEQIEKLFNSGSPKKAAQDDPPKLDESTFRAGAFGDKSKVQDLPGARGKSRSKGR